MLLLGPEIVNCVKKHLNAYDLIPQMKKGSQSMKQYYNKIVTHKFGLTMPGIGYDTYWYV